MLTVEQRQLISASVPLLETGGEALTRHFYQRLFERYPQASALFNSAHQHSGMQAKALARAILMYARHINELGELSGLVEQIVHKHVSLNILPEHYPWVGECLLLAIREVLGEEIATDALLDAWGKAYWQLAEILINAEGAHYAETALQQGGWRGARQFRLVRREQESAEIQSLYWEPVDQQAVVAALPGQFIGVQLQVDGQEQRRNYSISSLAQQTGYRISVKRESAGVVSNVLHNAPLGYELGMFPPAGNFVLAESERPLVLICGGVGITPTLAMLEAALPTGRAVHFIQCARNRAVMGFDQWLNEQAQQYPTLQRFVCLSEPEAGDQADATGFLTQELLSQWMPTNLKEADVYFLGPVPFMRAVRKHLSNLGVPSDQVRYEWFGPADTAFSA